jgi:hypothetical protein
VGRVRSREGADKPTGKEMFVSNLASTAEPDLEEHEHAEGGKGFGGIGGSMRRASLFVWFGCACQLSVGLSTWRCPDTH